MEYIIYALVALVAVLTYAAQPRAPKQKRPSLEDFDVPRANQGDPVPMIFGTVTLSGPMVVWYGDLLVDTETEDGVTTRRYFMGLHFILCHGPIDHFTAIYAGDREAWTGDVTVSDTITINAGSLFGGKRQAGGIAGDVDIMMGESTQTANAYLTAVQGTPQPGYRGVVGVVCNQVLIGANTPRIEPWAFKLNRIYNGWDNDACWYSTTAGIVDVEPSATALYDAIIALSPIVYLRFEEPISEIFGDLRGQDCVNSGSGPNGYYVDACLPDVPLVSDGSQSVTIYTDVIGGSATGSQGRIDIEADAAINYDSVGTFWIGCKFRTRSDVRSQTSHYLYHQGDHANPGDQGLGLAIAIDTTDYVTLLFFSATSNAFEYAIVYLPEQLQGDTDYQIFVKIDATAAPTMWVYWGCNADYLGTAACAELDLFPTVYELHVCAVGGYYAGFPATAQPSYSLRGAVDNWLMLPGSVTAGQISTIAGLMCSGTMYLMNPAHIIYSAITDPRGMGIPVSLIDDDSFRDAADTFYTERLGLCLKWMRQEKVESFIQHICDHAACVLRVSPRTGKFQLKPLRGDYTASTLTVYDEEQIQSVDSWERLGYGELVGEVTLTYHDYLTDADGAVTLQNLAVIQAQSGVVAESIDLPGIPTAAIARRVCMRELKARSIPLARCKIKLNRTAWELLPGDVFKLSWAKLGLTEVIMRVTGIDTGTLTDGLITLEATEDVFGMPDSTYSATQASGWTDEAASDPGLSGTRYEEDGTTQRRQQAGTIRIVE